jgi:hypothetical protein
MNRRMLRNRGFATVTTSSGLLVSVNPRRWALVISAPLTSRITLDFGGPAVLDQGIVLYPATLPLLLSSEHIGEGLKEDIFAIGAVGSQTIGWMEILWG